MVVPRAWFLYDLFKLRDCFNTLEKLVLSLKQRTFVIIFIFGPIHDENHKVDEKAEDLTPLNVTVVIETFSVIHDCRTKRQNKDTMDKKSEAEY